MSSWRTLLNVLISPFACVAFLVAWLIMLPRWGGLSRSLFYWPWGLWEVSLRECPSVSVQRCRQPVFHETIQTLGGSCSECEPSRIRPAYRRAQIGPFVVVQFESPWNE